MDSQWTWSEPYRDYYRVSYDADGNLVYIWSRQQQVSPLDQQPQQAYPDNAYSTNAYASHQQSQAPAYSQGASAHHSQWPPTWSVTASQVQSNGYQPSPAPTGQQLQQYGVHSGRTRADSADDEMPPPVSHNLRAHLPNLIPGTPHLGPRERLDSSYYMRHGKEAHEFFKVGRVFAMLWAEAASETAARQQIRWPSNATLNTDITVGPFLPGRFGERVYSQIRRFVIVETQRKKHFVKACPITTYSKRGTLKANCYPPEHAVAYFYGSQPVYLQGETGMTKDPIEIYPSTPGEVMEPTSRIRFGRTYPVEWNVKVKDIGQVMSTHKTRLIQYWKEEEANHDTGGSDDEINF